jgi:hypothetical protein
MADHRLLKKKAKKLVSTGKNLGRPRSWTVHRKEWRLSTERLEPTITVSERAKTVHALDRWDTVTGRVYSYKPVMAELVLTLNIKQNIHPINNNSCVSVLILTEIKGKKW